MSSAPAGVEEGSGERGVQCRSAGCIWVLEKWRVHCLKHQQAGEQGALAAARSSLAHSRFIPSHPLPHHHRTWAEAAGLLDEVVADLAHQGHQARRAGVVLGVLPDEQQGVQDGLEEAH